MRLTLIGGLVLALSACALPSGGSTTATTLTAADAATSLAVGQELAMSVTTHSAPEGMDPTVILSLRHSDGRVMSFTESNHAPTHVMAQAPGGPLAQTMGLFGNETPTLYSARSSEHSGPPFICGAEGPAHLGVYEAADGAVQIVGLKQDFHFETLPDGTQQALPYSPDQVCARLRFEKS